MQSSFTPLPSHSPPSVSVHRVSSTPRHVHDPALLPLLASFLHLFVQLHRLLPGLLHWPPDWAPVPRLSPCSLSQYRSQVTLLSLSQSMTFASKNIERLPAHSGQKPRTCSGCQTPRAWPSRPALSHHCLPLAPATPTSWRTPRYSLHTSTLVLAVAPCGKLFPTLSSLFTLSGFGSS